MTGVNRPIEGLHMHRETFAKLESPSSLQLFLTWVSGLFRRHDVISTRTPGHAHDATGNLEKHMHKGTITIETPEGTASARASASKQAKDNAARQR